MSTTTTLPSKAASKLDKPVANGSQPEVKTKTVPKMKSAVSASKAPLPPTNPQPKIIPQAFDSGIRVYPGPIKKQPIVAKASRSTSAASQASSTKPMAVKQKTPTDAPIVVKKAKARKLDPSSSEDMRSASTSTTASNVSTASTFSVASTATSMSAASAKSTETVKPNGIAKKKAVLPTKVKAKPQDTATDVQPTTKKVSTTNELPLSKDVPKAKPTTTKLDGALKPATATGDASDAAAADVQLPRKIIAKKKKPAAPIATVLLPEQPKGEPLGAKSVNGLPKSAQAPIVKKKAVKPKTTSNPTTAAVEESAVVVPPTQAEPGKTENVPRASAQTLEPTTPSSKKSKVPKLNGTVKKTILKPRPQTTSTDGASDSAKPVSLKTSSSVITKAAATTETRPVPEPASQALAAATTAAKRIVSAPISATPRSIKAPRIKPRSTTPPPAGIQRPQTDGPAARRKSVTFRSPLEAFQIIPARRASTPPPSTSSRRSSIASVSKAPERPKEPTIEEPLPAEPVVSQQPVDEVDADDLVFQDEQDELDQLPDMSALRPNDSNDEPDTSRPLDPPTTLDAIPEEPTEIPEPTTTSDAGPTVPSDHDELPTTTAPPSINSYRPPSAADDDDDDDDSTIFFDADESYVPHYNGSPRKSGTPRLRTPGSAGSRLPKLGKTPDLKDSPKLNLLRLNSPVRKVKKRKSVGEKVKEGVAKFEGVKSPVVQDGGEVGEVGEVEA